MTKIHIDEVCSKSTTYPLIVNFLHGSPTGNFGPVECLLLKKDKNPTKTVLTKVENLLYVGEEEKDDLCNTFIVKRNKITGKVQIFEAGTVNLKPVINGNDDNVVTTEANALELSRKFGSKKMKKAMEQREKLKVNVETVTEQMQNITQEISENTIDLSAYNVNNDDFYIPKINRTAKKAEDVYRMVDMLTEEQYNKITSELANKDYESDLLPCTMSLVANRTLPEKETVLLVYANSLLRLFNTPAKDIQKKGYVICPHSLILNDFILSNFTSTSHGRRVRPLPYKDKALCYAIVFLLLINNLQLGLDGLCETLKLSPATVSLKAKVTGASMVNTGGKKMIQIKLPINTKTISRRKSTKF